MRKRKSEIATILMVGAVVVMGVTAVITSFTQNDKRTTSSRASCLSSQLTCIGETNVVCCNKTTQMCGWDAKDKRICQSKPTITSPTPIKKPTLTPTKKPVLPSVSPTDEIPSSSGEYDCNGKSGNPYPVDTNTQCSNYCQNIGSVYVKNSQGTLDGQHYCCCGTLLPTNGPIPNPDGSNNDSCWLIKCKSDGSTDVRLYAQSLSAVGMPASSCSGGSAYGNGILVLNEQKANFQCEGGSVVAIPPTAAPIDPDPFLELPTTSGDDINNGCYEVSKNICDTSIESYVLGQGKRWCCPMGETPQELIPEPTIIPKDGIINNISDGCIPNPSKSHCGTGKYTLYKYPNQGYCCNSKQSSPSQIDELFVVMSITPEPTKEVKDDVLQWYKNNCISGVSTKALCSGNHSVFEKYKGVGYCCTYKKPTHNTDDDKIYQVPQIVYNYYNCRYIPTNPMLWNCALNCKANEVCAIDYLIQNPRIYCCEEKHLK